MNLIQARHGKTDNDMTIFLECILLAWCICECHTCYCYLFLNIRYVDILTLCVSFCVRVCLCCGRLSTGGGGIEWAGDDSGNAQQDQHASNIVTGTPVQPLHTAPSGLTLTGYRDTEVHLSWTSVEGATYYIVQVSVHTCFVAFIQPMLLYGDHFATISSLSFFSRSYLLLTLVAMISAQIPHHFMMPCLCCSANVKEVFALA